MLFGPEKPAEAQRIGRMGFITEDPNGDDYFIYKMVFDNTDITTSATGADATVDLSAFTSGVTITDATPDLTLYNDETSDADYGRASFINFDGAQSGGERSRLGSISVAHDGTGDDQKGIMTIKMNDGDDSDDPSDVIWLDASGLHFGAPEGTIRVLFSNIGNDNQGAGMYLYDSSGGIRTYITGDGGSDSYIGTGGNFGINDTTPNAQLDIDIDGAAVVGLDIDGAAAQSAHIVDIDDATGDALFTIDATGQVGILTNVPLAELDVSGDIYTSSINFGVDDATNDTYVVTLGSVGAYVAGMIVYFDALHANVGACTLNVNSLGAKSLKSLNNQDPANDYIEARSIVHCIYDGTNFQILSPDANP